MAETADNDWVNKLPNEDRATARTLGFTDCTPKHRPRTKQLVPNWREVVLQFCLSQVTLDKGMLARHLGISKRTLETRLKKPEDELGNAIRNARVARSQARIQAPRARTE